MQVSHEIIFGCSKAHGSADANTHGADGDGAGGDADAGESKVQGRDRVLKQVGVGGEEGWGRDGHSLLHHLPQHACLSGLFGKHFSICRYWQAVTGAPD